MLTLCQPLAPILEILHPLSASHPNSYLFKGPSDSPENLYPTLCLISSLYFLHDTFPWLGSSGIFVFRFHHLSPSPTQCQNRGSASDRGTCVTHGSILGFHHSPVGQQLTLGFSFVGQIIQTPATSLQNSYLESPRKERWR